MGVDWLREWADDCIATAGTYPYSAGQLEQAARGMLALLAERDTLRARVAELEAALKPFAAWASHPDFNDERYLSPGDERLGLLYDRWGECGPDPNSPTVGDLRRAAESLAKGERDA